MSDHVKRRVMANTDITTADIRKLRTEAGQHNDLAQVAICDIALGNELGVVNASIRAMLERKGLLVEGGQARAIAECGLK